MYLAKHLCALASLSLAFTTSATDLDPRQNGTDANAAVDTYSVEGGAGGYCPTSTVTKTTTATETHVKTTTTTCTETETKTVS
jgi:hypothetical protein